MNENEEGIRISITTAVLMISVAFFYDTVQALFNLIPALGQILSYLILPLSFLTFNVVWFHIHDISFMESLVGKAGRAGFKRILTKFGIPVVLEVFTLGIAPGITIWITFTILGTRFDDKLVQKGIVTREQLKQVNEFVISLAKKHGTESPEFRKALMNSLGQKAKERATTQIRNNLNSSKTYSTYRKMSATSSGVGGKVQNMLDLSAQQSFRDKTTRRPNNPSDEDHGLAA